MPALDRKELEESPLSDLHAIASELGIEGYRRLRREDLIDALAAVGEGTTGGAAIVRVHDVAATRDFLTVRAALRGEIDVPRELRLDQTLRRQAGSPA